LQPAGSISTTILNGKRETEQNKSGRLPPLPLLSLLEEAPLQELLLLCQLHQQPFRARTSVAST
jgi:hypothetical protein